MTNPISGSAGPSDANRADFAKTRAATLDAAADLLQESPDQLKTELQSGQSLADIAKAKGVSQDDLQKAISDAVKGANPNATADQVAKITQRAIAGHHHHHHGGGQPPAPVQANQTLPPDATISIKA